MKWINYPLIASLMLPLMACTVPTAPPKQIDGALFCDVEQRRVFTREEAELRAERFPENLRKDIKTNATFDRECE